VEKPRCLVLFTKPARPGRVKTRLVGELTAEEAARLHQAFLDDLLERLRQGHFDLRVAWDLDPDDELPAPPWPGARSVRQEGRDLGRRLHRALSEAGHHYAAVAALGSDHPHIPLEAVHDAFERVEAGADLVLGPAEDGGYYLVAVPGPRVPRRIFEAVPWSTSQVLPVTIERSREEGLRVELLATGWDVDRPEDLDRLAAELTRDDHGCRRTRSLLEMWGRLGAPVARGGDAG
jgi:rSAM/selenodomain-associated transferase 1